MPPFRIDVYVKWKPEQVGIRRWSAVPRLGDLVAVEVDREMLALQVSSVIWGTTPESREVGGEAQVSIVLDRPR